MHLLDNYSKFSEVILITQIHLCMATLPWAEFAQGSRRLAAAERTTAIQAGLEEGAAPAAHKKERAPPTCQSPKAKTIQPRRQPSQLANQASPTIAALPLRLAIQTGGFADG